MKTMQKVLVAGCLLLGTMSESFALPTLSAEGPLTARHFARPPSYQSVKLSPDGRYLAVSAVYDGVGGLLFFSLPDKKLVYGTRFQNGMVAGEINWVSDERLLVSLAAQDLETDTPAFTGELFAINANGSGSRYLFGYNSSTVTIGTRLPSGPEREIGFATVAATLPDLPGTALVQVTKNTTMTVKGRYFFDSFTPLSSIDAYTGRRREVAAAPTRTVRRYFADSRGRVSLASGVSDDSYQLKNFWRPGEGEWRAVPITAMALQPLQLSRDGKRAYFDAEYANGRECLLEWTLPASVDAPADNAREVLCKDQPFLGQVFFTADTRPYGYATETGVVVIDAKPVEARALASLQEQFVGQRVTPVHATRTHDKLLFHVESDRNSGEYYIFDAKKMEAGFFDAVQAWLDPERMASVKRISYAARDGLVIDGYLTLPPGKPVKSLPMVVLPHGGPIGVRDRFGWDADAQFLASRGYAVLQANYRGSSNHGELFEKKGYGEWGGKMIDDLSDGARWAVSQGFADGNRLCIFGGSYGGYAALMSAVREPDLYRCAVGYAGVYDLNLLLEESVNTKRNSNRLFYDDVLGKTEAERDRLSPIRYLDQLKAAVFIVHGEDDVITPLSQAKALRAGLEARRKPYDWLVKAREGHGFFNEENRVEFYEKLAAFLDKHIGQSAAPPVSK